MTTYETEVTQVLYMDGDDAREILTSLDQIEDGWLVHGATAETIDAAIEHLKQWDYGEDGLTVPLADLNPGEKRERLNEYILTWHTGLGYLSLDREVEAQ